MRLAQGYQDIRAASEMLADPLSAEDCSIQSMEDASPTKWHLAHTTWFFETLVLEAAIPDYKPFDPHFRTLFNSYYETLGEPYPRPRRGLLSRPGFDEVIAYRRHVDAAMLTLIDDLARESAELEARVELGLHHEQQHQELVLTDIKHALSCNPLRPAYRDAPPPPRGEATPLEFFAYPAGLRQIGHQGPGFAFDNELPRHRVYLEGFALASRPVSNAEYLAFMEADGYQRPELWLSDGWAAVQREGWRAPLYWQRDAAGWRVLTLSGPQPLCPAEPVCHVSYFEADAYARWAGARLPAEAEWESAADGPVEGNFVESGFLQPRPTTRREAAPAALFGDVWEWTRSAYAPYPGFRPLRGALAEYNGKFMSNQVVLRGGSCATPTSHVRRTYRNFFYPHQRWQFSGIRLARDDA